MFSGEFGYLINARPGCQCPIFEIGKAILNRPCVILTDSVEEAESFFNRALEPEGATAPRGGDKGRSPCDPALARAFFGRKTVHSLTVPSVSFRERFRLLILQEWAARSNLEMLTELQRGRAALPDGLVCAAVAGQGFLGRFDRSWQSVRGNLHAVIHLEPALTLEQAGPAFSILAAVACVESIRPMTSGADGAMPDRSPLPRIKWINDVCIGPRKVAGVLTRQTYQDPHITDVFLGIGVNVLAEPDLEPDRFVPAAGSLASSLPRSEWSPGLFLAAFLERVDHWYDRLLTEGATSLVDAYRSHSSVLNRTVRIYEDGFRSSGEGSNRLVARGRVMEILDDLSLRIDGVAGPIASGRLAFEADCE